MELLPFVDGAWPTMLAMNLIIINGGLLPHDEILQSDWYRYHNLFVQCVGDIYFNKQFQALHLYKGWTCVREAMIILYSMY